MATRQEGRPGATADVVKTLTIREMQVLRGIADGRRLKDIARGLRISPKTADKARGRLMDKLDIHDRVQLALFAVRAGLTERGPDELDE